MDDNSIVELNNVYLQSDRDERVYSDLNFRLEAGRSAVIMGPAGSGKTSLVELLVGLRFPREGSGELFGKCITKWKRGLIRRTRMNIGGIGGIYGLVPSYTVAENIVFPLVIAGERRKVRRKRLFKMLTEFSLLKQANEYPSALTRVEYTLTEFARASVANQPLMIIDELTAGLDPPTCDRMCDYMINLSQSGRSMIILTSEVPVREFPNTDYYQIANGALV